MPNLKKILTLFRPGFSGSFLTSVYGVCVCVWEGGGGGGGGFPFGQIINPFLTKLCRSDGWISASFFLPFHRPRLCLDP